MHKNFKLTLAAATLFTTTVAFMSTSLLAHTRLEVPEVTEGVRTSNNLVIGHGCGENNVIGTSVVFPDGADSTVTVDGAAYTGKITDFIENWGNLNQQIYNTAVFTFQEEKEDDKENVVGFWSGGGNSLPHHLTAYIPFRVSAATFKADHAPLALRSMFQLQISAKSRRFLALVRILLIFGPIAIWIPLMTEQTIPRIHPETVAQLL